MSVINRLIKRNILVLGILVQAVTGRAQQIGSYLTSHKIIATVLAEHYGIPASVILAVAAVESSCGEGSTAKVLNNHFGIVGKNNISANGRKSRYKQYDNVFASYIDFCKMISHKRYYARLKDNDDPKLWIKAMSKAGYSEQPAVWEKKILGFVFDNRL